MQCYTIGHSNRSIEEFIDLLNKQSVNCVVDARSMPYSKYAIQFNKDSIKNFLENSKIYYIFMGDEIGAKTEDKKFLTNGKVDFNKLKEKPDFKKGIDRIIEGLCKKYNIAIMCSEKNPVDCHRFSLISKALKEKGICVKHIINQNEIKTQEELEYEIVKNIEKNQLNIFGELKSIDYAYEKITSKISYKVGEKK
ncbi:MAG: DUF488 domain-containing protein [Candidatus Humimicrobiaceae bacterium]